MARRPLPGSPPGPTGRLLGYARVSTEDQATDAQTDELRAAGCAAIYQEHGSGASRARPELARLMREIRPGDVLVVVRLDRLARSVSHLLEVIERLEESGAHFRSLRDPIDTSTPQGMFSLQVLGAVAQLERALISERTKAGIKAAQARGKLSGNPGLRARDPGRDRQGGAGAKPGLHRRCHCVDGPMAADGPAHAAPIPLGGRGAGPQSGRRVSMDHRAPAASRWKSRARGAGGRQPAGKNPAQTARGPADDDGRRHRHGKS